VAITIPIITDFNSKGIDSATRQFQKLETTGKKAAFAVKKAAIPAGIALVALAAGAVDAANAAMQDQAAQDQLTRSLDKTTTASDGAIKSVDAWVTSLSQASSVADDELRPALATLARGTGDLKAAQDGLKIALDVSAATGRPLATVSKALSAAYAGNATALGKLDPHVKAMIKNGASADEVIAAMAGRFKGDAAASADTAAGRMKGLGIAIDETKESIGAALMPAINAVLPVLQAFGKWAQEHSGVFVALAAAVGVLALAIMGANLAMAILALNPVVLTIVGIAAAVALLAIGFKLLWDRSKTFQDVLKGVWEAVQGYVEIVVDYFKGPLMAAWDIVSGAIDAISALIRGDFGAAWEGLKTMIGGVIEWIKTTLLALPLLILGYAVDIGTSIVNGIVSGVATLGESTWNAISGIATYLLNKAGEWLEELAKLGGKVIEWIVSGVTGLGQKIWDKIDGFVGFIGEKLAGVKDSVVGFGSQLFEWIGDGITSAAKGMAVIIINAVNKVIGFLNTAAAGVNKGIGLVNALIPGGDPVGEIPKIPTLAVPKGATGGIVTRPTLAMIGEAGPEAVIPLNRTPGSSALGGMGGITINVQAGLVSTPDQIGQQIIEAIQNAQRRSGPVFAAA
jgi:hypothetical protein